MALSTLVRARALSRLLNARHYAEGRAWGSPSTIEHQWFTNGARNANSQAGNKPRPLSAQTSTSKCVVNQAMLRIERDSDGCVTKLTLIGRIQSNHIALVQSAMNDACERTVLDLSQVTLVDLGVIRFLVSCEDRGVELVECPPYVREWILRERAEGARSDNA
jgi:hypothetical protein